MLAAQQQPPVITASARLVVLDVVASDKSGKPIDNLTAADFQVYEDGRLQRIRSVEPPSAHVLPPTSEAANTVFDPAKPASFGQSPVDVLVLDQLNTHFADSAFARSSLHDFLSTQPAVLRQPTTLLSVYDNHFKQLQGFTRDRDALLHALGAAPTEYAWRLELNGKADHGPIERLDQSLRALEEMAQSYARIPGRKNLIWVGGGFPSMDPEQLGDHDMKTVKDAMHHVTNVLLNSRVTLYAVDPTTTAMGMTEIIDASQMSFAQYAGDSLAGGTDPFGATEDFDTLGPMTGGRVIRARNDVARLIGESVDLGANFYTIAYTPSSNSDASANLRRIQVVCLQPGITTATRNGYYAGAEKPEDALADATYDLTTAAETMVPLNGLHITAEPDTVAGAYHVRVTVPSLTWKPKPDGGASASVYVMAVSLNNAGKMMAHTVHAMTSNARPGANLADESKSTDFLFLATPAPKAAKLRFIVRDSASGRMGSVDLPVGR
jgi:VWFA-related protein